jgi:hypothetical protein
MVAFRLGKIICHFLQFRVGVRAPSMRSQEVESHLAVGWEHRRMSDEFTFVIAKALLVIAFAAAALLVLAWIAATKCFPEARRSPAPPQAPQSSRDQATDISLAQLPRRTA